MQQNIYTVQIHKTLVLEREQNKKMFITWRSIHIQMGGNVEKKRGDKNMCMRPTDILCFKIYVSYDTNSLE